MQPMRMHRSEFHVNLITRSRVSIETPKNNNIHNLISKCVRVVPREALLWYYRSKTMNIFEMISNELKFGGHFVCFFIYRPFIVIYGEDSVRLPSKMSGHHCAYFAFLGKHMARVDSLRVDCRG